MLPVTRKDHRQTTGRFDSVESKLQYRRLGTWLCGTVHLGVRKAQSCHDLAYFCWALVNESILFPNASSRQRAICKSNSSGTRISFDSSLEPCRRRYSADRA